MTRLLTGVKYGTTCCNRTNLTHISVCMVHTDLTQSSSKYPTVSHSDSFMRCKTAWALRDITLILFTTKKQLYTEIDYASGSFLYTEIREPIEWKLESGSEKEILGYSCQKASADFRGRHWTVWYTGEIAMSAGPYKLDGLPGTVLEARSEDGHLHFKAISIRNAHLPIIIPAISTAESHFFKSTRILWYQAIARHKWDFKNALAVSGLTPKSADGKDLEFEARVLPFYPVELDWMSKEMREKWNNGANPIK